MLILLFVQFTVLDETKAKTRDLPLMPYETKVEDEEVGFRKRKNESATSEKLLLFQNDKHEFLLQYRLSKFYVSMGVKVTKIPKIKKFKEDYI